MEGLMTLLIFGAFFISVPASAGSKPEPNMDAIVAAMSKCVRPSKTSIRTFHWEKKYESNGYEYDLSTKAGQLAYVRELSTEFLRTDQERGFYMASDPSQ